MANENDPNQNENQTPPVDGTPKTYTVTEDQINAMVNRAVTAQLKRVQVQAQPAQQQNQETDEKKTLTARIVRLEEEKAAERAGKLQEKRENSLRAALAGAGASNVEGAIAILERKGYITQAADGTVNFRQKFGADYLPEIDDVPIEKGVKEWLSGEEGSWYAAARDAGGSGARQGKRTGNNTTPTNDRERRRLEQAEELNRAFGKV